MEQRFTLSDIQRTKAGEVGVASVTLTPVASEPVANAMPSMPYGIGTTVPSPVRITGIPAADVADWVLDDTFSLIVTKQ